MPAGALPPSAPPLSEDALALLQGQAEPAILLSPDYVILATNAAYEAHYGARVRPGRDRCYRVSHGYASPCDENGESCPLQRAKAERRPARVFHIHSGPGGPEHVDVTMRPILRDDGTFEAFLEVVRVVPQVSAGAEGTFVGRSPAFVGVVELMQRVAPSETPVLILGESGTGKELVARAIHEASPRARGPYVPLECSGLPEALFESELFGHRKGAFTGATVDHGGLVEAARGGTLFLDEIGDVPRTLQVKLLRLLETGRYRRVGETEPRRADFRLLCATHRDLDALMASGDFRRDLYYRISAFPLELPPLRERRGDVALLADALLRAAGSRKRLSAEALAALDAYPFPGNVRELRNVLERACLLADGEILEARHLPPHVRAPGTLDDAPEAEGPWPWGDTLLPLAEVEHRYVTWAKERFGGDRRSLARRLGLSERTLYRRLQGPTR